MTIQEAWEKYREVGSESAFSWDATPPEHLAKMHESAATKALAIAIDLWSAIQDGLAQIAALKAERDALKAELADLNDSIVSAQRENPDEQHCTCVPLLKAEIQRLKQGREVVWTLDDDGVWTCPCGFKICFDEFYGPSQAEVNFCPGCGGRIKYAEAKEP